MNAKELRAEAEYFIDHPHCECDHEVGVYNCMGCGIDRMARHVLATVRDDDDEAVTREWLHEIGGKDVPSDMGPEYEDHVEFGFGSNFWDFNGEYWLFSPADSYPLRKRRQVRQLCLALGIELKEPQQ